MCVIYKDVDGIKSVSERRRRKDRQGVSLVGGGDGQRMRVAVVRFVKWLERSLKCLRRIGQVGIQMKSSRACKAGLMADWSRVKAADQMKRDHAVKQQVVYCMSAISRVWCRTLAVSCGPICFQSSLSELIEIVYQQLAVDVLTHRLEEGDQ